MKSGNQIEFQRNEIVVVTGTSTGIGNATAKELARRGFYVLAGVRRAIDADAIRGKNIEPVMLDITNEAVFSFPLPGGITTYMTGKGLYYPDGTCMQRAGVRIDEIIKPTIDGIKKEIDEPLEKAIEIVKRK